MESIGKYRASNGNGHIERGSRDASLRVVGEKVHEHEKASREGTYREIIGKGQYGDYM